VKDVELKQLLAGYILGGLPGNGLCEEKKGKMRGKIWAEEG